VFYLQLDAIKHGIEPEIAFYSVSTHYFTSEFDSSAIQLSVLNASSIFGRVLPSMIAQYFGVYNLIVPSTLCIGITIFCMAAVTNVAGVMVFAILFGFFSGGSMLYDSPALSSAYFYISNPHRYCPHVSDAWFIKLSSSHFSGD
jgi:hypothetical protein